MRILHERREDGSHRVELLDDAGESIEPVSGFMRFLAAFGSNAADAGCGIDVVADLLGHGSVSSAQVYLHPDPARLRAAVDLAPSPRQQVGVTR